MITKTKIEKCLDESLDALKTKGITFIETSKDGRVNSSLNESLVIDEIKGLGKLYKNWGTNGFDVPEVRSWCDYFILGDELENGFEKFPVNVKITSGKDTDNLNCKLGLYYAFTGKIPDFTNQIGWKSFFKRLKKDLNIETDKDYYFLILIKEDLNKSFWTSLKRIKKLTANGNNLPFQCDWLANKDTSLKSSEDSYNYIMNTLHSSLKLRSAALLEFESQDFLVLKKS